MSPLPVIPDNALGGLLGFLAGSHPLRSHNLHSDWWLVRHLAMPITRISRRIEAHRENVLVFLNIPVSEALYAAQQNVEPAVQQRQGEDMWYHNVVVKKKVDTHGQQQEMTNAMGVFNFDDYQRNKCWICQDSGIEWDLWTTCRHTFCSECSGKMLERRMPCPLCRAKSGTILRCACSSSEMSSVGTCKAEDCHKKSFHRFKRRNSLGAEGLSKPGLFYQGLPSPQTMTDTEQAEQVPLVDRRQPESDEELARRLRQDEVSSATLGRGVSLNTRTAIEASLLGELAA